MLYLTPMFEFQGLGIFIGQFDFLFFVYLELGLFLISFVPRADSSLDEFRKSYFCSAVAVL